MNETAPSKAVYQSLLFIFLGLILGLIIAAALWYFFVQDGKTKPPSNNTSTTSAKTTLPNPSPSMTVNDETLIKNALVAKTGIAANVIQVSVTQKSGNHAKGLVSAKGEMGGGYFLAFKESDTAWAIVFDGQSTPACDMVSPYNFPVSMVPECLDAAGNPVQR